MADTPDGHPELPPLSEVAEAKYKQFHPEDVGQVYQTTASAPPATRSVSKTEQQRVSDKGGNK